MSTPIVTPETTLRELNEALVRFGLRLRCYVEPSTPALAEEDARARWDFCRALEDAFKAGAR